MRQTAKRRVVKVYSYSQQAYDYIVRKIYSGQYPPGTQLKEGHLAEVIGISATPVREALRRLEKEYWVTIIPYNGAYVKELTFKEIHDLYDIRSAHEGLAAKLCTQNMDQATLIKFEAILLQEEDMIKDLEVDFDTLPADKDPDLKFHQLLVESANNDRLKDMVFTSRMQERSLHSDSDYGLGRDQEIRNSFHAEHFQIFYAIRDGDADLAEKLVKEHILMGKEREIAFVTGDRKTEGREKLYNKNPFISDLEPSNNQGI